MKNYSNLIVPLTLTIILIFIRPIIAPLIEEPPGVVDFIIDQSNIMIIITVTWSLIAVVKILKRILLDRYDISKEDNLQSRKVVTQVNLLARILIFIIILFGIGMVLLSFENIRKIGIGLFASAGVAGIIVGLAAQKAIGTILAGIQLAVTTPFRIDDAVIVEDEWGWIEEINLTYVVVRLWDKRRLVVPSTYFIDKPFQNWTRTSADIIGTVYIYTDYTMPVSVLRNELTRLLEGNELWDGNVNVLQVTDAKESTVELRALVSAKNSPTVWDLRVYIREKLIEFIQNNYPESLPKTRIQLDNKKSAKNNKTTSE
jgi:small-conductance mechanosensitive channel